MAEKTQSGADLMATIAVHGHERSGEISEGAVIAPVFHSSTYGFASFAEMRAYARGEMPDKFFYSRYANPTVAEAERRIAALERAEDAAVFSSGSAATFAVVAALCEAGDDIIATDSIYGGSTKIFKDFFGRFGVATKIISIDDIPKLPELTTPRTKLFWFESPANPLGRLVDLKVAADSARAAGLISVIDSTFATPILQRPLEFGVDAVMHSATKYLGGHSDLTAGVVAGSRDLIGRMRAVSMRIGTTLDPAAAALITRGLRTLDLRVRAANDSALKLAQSLDGNPSVDRVHYLGLGSNPDHALGQRQMAGGFGAVVAFDIKGGEPAVERFFDGLKLVRNAPSLGGVESLISYPLYTSHTGFSDEQLRAAGITSGTVRISVGIEASADIIADVTQALVAVRTNSVSV
ncbi:MAG: aminotransferase class I/II-fold pyridoxal phosphate-dependent enzyme [Pyrinomonadaceae bacterium]